MLYKLTNKGKPITYITTNKWYEQFSKMFTVNEYNQLANSKSGTTCENDVSLNEIQNILYLIHILASVKHLSANKAVAGNLIPQHVMHEIHALLPFVI